ncbi:MAG: Rieske (2Fe-2S) protein [Pseudomonadota bacterium]|nr:Rieske (2Fe-2S) protein [Pseudomonadota bacterium]
MTAERLCASEALVERGKAVTWTLRQYGQPVRAFALRVDGRVVAYLNRCAHVPTEMDWQPDEFLDMNREWIICALHGATYDPRNGRCIGGPCAGARLTPVATEERDGQVWWQPTGDLRAIPDTL